MRTRLFSLLSLLFAFIPILFLYSQEKKIVIFAEADSLPSNSQIYITGGNDELGNWFKMQKMKKRSFNNWSFKTFANTGDTLQFKFTRGDWNSEALIQTEWSFPTLYLLLKVIQH